jgi:hypothetical protein
MGTTIHGWGQLLVRPRNFVIVALLAFVAASAYKPKFVCRSDWRIYMGETVTFAGEYMSDHIERSVVLPKGCDRGVGVGRLSPQAEKVLESADEPPYRFNRRIEAIFTGTLVQEEPNGFLFYKDNGVRLNISNITDLKITDPTGSN